MKKIDEVQTDDLQLEKVLAFFTLILLKMLETL